LLGRERLFLYSNIATANSRSEKIERKTNYANSSGRLKGLKLLMYEALYESERKSERERKRERARVQRERERERERERARERAREREGGRQGGGGGREKERVQNARMMTTDISRARHTHAFNKHGSHMPEQTLRHLSFCLCVTHRADDAAWHVSVATFFRSFVAYELGIRSV
jgi:hypothetical protein